MFRAGDASDIEVEVVCAECGQLVPRDVAHDTHGRSGEQWWCPEHCPQCLKANV
jgi:hypothetical protein